MKKMDFAKLLGAVLALCVFISVLVEYVNEYSVYMVFAILACYLAYSAIKDEELDLLS